MSAPSPPPPPPPPPILFICSFLFFSRGGRPLQHDPRRDPARQARRLRPPEGPPPLLRRLPALLPRSVLRPLPRPPPLPLLPPFLPSLLFPPDPRPPLPLQDLRSLRPPDQAALLLGVRKWDRGRCGNRHGDVRRRPSLAGAPYQGIRDDPQVQRGCGGCGGGRRGVPMPRVDADGHVFGGLIGNFRGDNPRVIYV